MVQAVGDCRGGRLVNQAQNVQACKLRRVFCRLALSVVKIGGHGDHGTVNIVVKTVFGTLTQGGENFRTDLNRTFLARYGLQGDHAGLVDELVRQLRAIGDVIYATPHETLGRCDGIARIFDLGGQRCEADLAALGIQIAHHARQQHTPLGVWQAFGNPAAHAGHQ